MDADTAQFTMQGSATFIYWLTFAIVVALAVVGVYVIYKLAALPGEIAHGRGHPQASAIGIAGWLGVIFLPLWPLAMIWAYLTPGDRPLQPPADLGSIQAGLRETSTRIAEIEHALGIKAGMP